MKSIESITRDMFVFGFEDFTFDDIVEVLKEADARYFNDSGNLLVNDAEYDALKQYAHALNPTHTYFLGVGSSVRGGKVKLPYPMGSLTQAYHGDIQKWVDKHHIEREEFVITEKLDGVSILIVYDDAGKLQIAYSRGDGFEGADITRHVSQIESVPVRVASRQRTVIRAEAIISKSNFAKVQTLIKSRSGLPYKNPRNMIAGVMNAETNPSVVYDYIDVVAYEIVFPADIDKLQQLDVLYEDNQFVIPAFVTSVGSHLTDDNLTKILNKMREESNYEIDGVVVEVSGPARKKINPTKDTLNPEYARKYKVADISNYAEPTVTGVTWGISKDGYLKPTIQLEPTTLVGVTIQNCTGFNAKFIKDNCIGPGAVIALTRSGDVIPFCQAVIKPAPGGPAMPELDAEWTSTGVDLVLKNANQDDNVRFEQLNDFFMTLDAPHLREGNLQKIFDAGVKTPEDVINLTQHDLVDILGSSVVAKKIFQGLREKLTNVPEYVLLGAHPALGRGVGVRRMKKLYEAFAGDVSKCNDRSAIVAVEGFDQKTATKIVNGFPAYQQFYSKVKDVVTLAPYQAAKTGSWSGQTVVMTGFRSKELEQLVVDQGGKIGSSVSAKTTLVVADDPMSTSGKAQKARELGIRLIGIEQFKQEVGG